MNDNVRTQLRGQGHLEEEDLEKQNGNFGPREIPSSDIDCISVTLGFFSVICYCNKIALSLILYPEINGLMFIGALISPSVFISIIYHFPN